ncbi:FHA domain-containing protein [Gulosibacter chungangensis]|uniref:FHA domain-containing protein n=1 Tax=Gulosibacter chungangensis TaxID=979746 RepID=A0A7J5B9G8_9MICO|nr:FHA domain-containing protein [Gulosibacter chungangensis]KAB1642254.1 FHA domain-containing protein [Gulosibacter chungangensis]
MSDLNFTDRDSADRDAADRDPLSDNPADLDAEVNPQRHPDISEHPPHADPPHYGKGPTTHSEYGAGDPRIVMTGVESEEGPPVFHLIREVTTIGSAPDNDIVLMGLLPHHARISHTDTDEYVLDSLEDTKTSSAGEASPTDDAPTGARLRHGGIFVIRDYGFSFQRSEYADHGRPFGGRVGGELSRQPKQDEAPDYRDEHRQALKEEVRLDAALEEHPDNRGIA